MTFYKHDDDVFNIGEVWYSNSEHSVVIKEVSKFGEGQYDYNVYYTENKMNTDLVYDKDIWNFQVRYSHSSELQKILGIEKEMNELKKMKVKLGQ